MAKARVRPSCDHGEPVPAVDLARLDHVPGRWSGSGTGRGLDRGRPGGGGRGADAAGIPVLVLGGGSNLLVADAGFPSRVVRIASRGLTADVSDCGGAYLRIAAGEPWDEVVARAVAEGWRGIEALSGIPGLAGATPVQNVGASASRSPTSIASVRAFTGRPAARHVRRADCGFGYDIPVQERTRPLPGAVGRPAAGPRRAVAQVRISRTRQAAGDRPGRPRLHPRRPRADVGDPGSRAGHPAGEGHGARRRGP